MEEVAVQVPMPQNPRKARSPVWLCKAGAEVCGWNQVHCGESGRWVAGLPGSLSLSCLAKRLPSSTGLGRSAQVPSLGKWSLQGSWFEDAKHDGGWSWVMTGKGGPGWNPTHWAVRGSAPPRRFSLAGCQPHGPQAGDWSLLGDKGSTGIDIGGSPTGKGGSLHDPPSANFTSLRALLLPHEPQVKATCCEIYVEKHSKCVRKV